MSSWRFELLLLDHVEGLLEGYAVSWLIHKHQSHQFLQNWMLLNLYLEVLVLDLIDYPLLRKVLLGHAKGKLPSAELIDGHAHTPDIATTDLFHLDALQDFRSHVLRSARKGNTLINVDYLGGQSEVGNFNLLIFNQDVCWLDVPMNEIFGSEVVACGDDLPGKTVYFLFVSLEEMLLDIFFQVAFAVFEEKVQIVGSLLDIEKLDNVRVLEALQSLVLLLDSINEVIEI